MLSVRKKYFRYSLFALILGMGAMIVITLRPLIGGLLGATTVYILLRKQMYHLTEECGWRRSVAAALLGAEAMICFLIPFSLIVWMLVVRIEDLTLHAQEIIRQAQDFAAVIYDHTGFNLWEEMELQNIFEEISKIGKVVLRNLIDLTFNAIALVFVLYFMLIGGYRMEDYCRELLPFDRQVSDGLMRDLHTIVRSNAIVIPLLALCQGFVAYLGYLIFGTPLPLFWAVLTSFASVVPMVGTALVWLPLAGWLLLEGRWGMALGLFIYGGLVVTHVDNIMRLLLQKRMADTHPLVTIAGVVIGIPLFGFIGVIFGPLMIALFIFCVRLFKRTYLDPNDKNRTGT